MKIVENKSKNIQAAQVISAETGEFVFKLERDEDTEYTLPLIQDLPAKLILELSDGAGVKEIFGLFDRLAPGLTDVATQRELALIMDAWSEASNVTLGES